MSESSQTTVEVQPSGQVNGSIRPPGSKSLTNRALICAALARGTTHLTGVLRSEDTEVMIDALRQLDVRIDLSPDGRVADVSGIGGSDDSHKAEVYVANSGTTIRFLTAMLSALGGNYRLHGIDRMHQRPIGDLLTAINQTGGGASSEQGDGCPPVRIDSQGWQGGKVTVGGNVSSQYLSGIMMAAPLSRSPLEIHVEGELVSRPYVDMTLAVIRSFGVDVTETTPGVFAVQAPCVYQAIEYDIEPDASAASYFWAAAAVSGGTVKVEGLTRAALQGDVGFVDCLAKMGCTVTDASDGITVAAGGPLRGIDVDMNQISDTVQTLSVVALFAEGPTTIHGVAHNRFKETDRITDLATELRKLGATIEEFDDGLKITPGPLRAATLETYNDHRMAMSFAVGGLRAPGIQIKNPACTAKTYPEYFADLQRLTGQSHHWTAG